MNKNYPFTLFHNSNSYLIHLLSCHANYWQCCWSYFVIAIKHLYYLHLFYILILFNDRRFQAYKNAYSYIILYAKYHFLLRKNLKANYSFHKSEIFLFSDLFIKIRSMKIDDNKRKCCVTHIQKIPYCAFFYLFIALRFKYVVLFGIGQKFLSMGLSSPGFIFA